MNFQENDPYHVCPTFESERFRLRQVEISDADDLLECYKNPTASVRGNADNCTYGYGSQTLEEMQAFIRGWLGEYKNRSFVRWSVVDKLRDAAVGTIEMFGGACGILRVDLLGGYEQVEPINEILDLILPGFFILFDCPIIVTKAVPAAEERIAALKRHGFALSEKPLVGSGGIQYNDYWILKRQG